MKILKFKHFRVLIFLIGFISLKKDTAYGFWNKSFNFETVNGDKVNVFKSKSECTLVQIVDEKEAKYGTKYLKFIEIYPLCTFRGTETKYSGLTFNYETSARCDKNVSICKAAKEFGFLKNFLEEKKDLKAKVFNQINEFNRSFKSRQNNDRKAYFTPLALERYKESKDACSYYVGLKKPRIDNAEAIRSQYDKGRKGYFFYVPNSGKYEIFISDYACWEYMNCEEKLRELDIKINQPLSASINLKRFINLRPSDYSYCGRWFDTTKEIENYDHERPKFYEL